MARVTGECRIPGMSEQRDALAGESMVGPHGAPDEHGEAHGHDDQAHGDDVHGGDALGPFDLRAWGAAGLGVVLGLIVMLAFIRAGS
jgi:hypothetical protein